MLRRPGRLFLHRLHRGPTGIAVVAIWSVFAVACTSGASTPSAETASIDTALTNRTSDAPTDPPGADLTNPAPTTSQPTATTGQSTTTTMTLSVPVVPDEPNPEPAPPPAGQEPPPGVTGAAIAATGGMPYAEEIEGAQAGIAHEGLVFAVIGRDGDWFELRTMCDRRVWAEADGLAFTPAPTLAHMPGTMDFADAVLVIDAGHGGPNLGATGPTGLGERIVDLDIARRTRDLLEAPHTIDWTTGAILDGDQIPAAGGVWLTRTEGPEGADYDTGLFFRAELANHVGAHAFVSIHNNASPDGPTERPGSEVFYRFSDDQSRRLAGLLMEEFYRGFTRFDVAWAGDTDAGAKYRLRDDGVTDYYGVLRNAEVPAVIAEGVFISQPEEEELLRTAGFRQAYAEAVYRALVRFITTHDMGDHFTVPYPRTIPAGSGNPRSECRIPEQPQ